MHAQLPLVTAFSGSAEYTRALENPITIIRQKSRLEAWKILKKRSLSGAGFAPVLAVYFRLFLRHSWRSSKAGGKASPLRVGTAKRRFNWALPTGGNRIASCGSQEILMAFASMIFVSRG